MPLKLGYSAWLDCMLLTDLGKFFGAGRWPRRQKETATLGLDDGISVMPPLWTKETKTLPNRHSVVPLHELVGCGFDIARQLAGG